MSGALMIRHAPSVWNEQGRWQGQADPPLSKQGADQARAAAATIGPVDLVVTSDLERARRTGAILAPSAECVTEPLLREFDVGAWSGCTRPEIAARWGRELALFDAGRLDAPPGGERRPDFDRRVGAAAARVALLVADAGADRTLVVTHGGVLRALARLQGLGDHHVAHLSGYEARAESDFLTVAHPVDLLDARGPRREGGDRTSL